MFRVRGRSGKIKSRKPIGRKLVMARGQGGIYLVEMLVALTVSSLLSAALVDSISSIHRFSNKAQSQMLASAMAEEVMDMARNLSFTDLTGQYQGSWNLQVNSTDPITPPNVFPRPLMVDSTTYPASGPLSWSPAGTANRFYGTVTENITMAADSTPTFPSVQVQVQVNWIDPGGGNRQYTAQTVIAQSGIHI